MLWEIPLQRAYVATSLRERTFDGLQCTYLFMFWHLGPPNSLEAAVKRALDWVADTDIVVFSRHRSKGIVMPAILASNFPVLALLGEVVTNVLPWEGEATLVGTKAVGITAPRVPSKVRLYAAQFPGPLASFFMVGAVDTEVVDPLLKVDIAEVVETFRLARGAAVVQVDPLLNAVLAVMAATADHLARVTQDFAAQLADKFVWNFPNELVHGSLDVCLG